MLNLKGLDVINDIINNYVKQFDLTAELGTDFCYWYTSDKIDYPLVVPEDDMKMFLLDAESRFPKVHAPIFLWCLHHEIGHSQTIDDLTEEEVKESAYIKEFEVQKEEGAYYAAPDEYAATEWAGKYMSTHAAAVSELWSRLLPAIQNFYKLNNIK